MGMTVSMSMGVMMRDREGGLVDERMCMAMMGCCPRMMITMKETLTGCNRR